MKHSKLTMTVVCSSSNYWVVSSAWPAVSWVTLINLTGAVGGSMRCKARERYRALCYTVKLYCMMIETKAMQDWGFMLSQDGGWLVSLQHTHTLPLSLSLTHIHTQEHTWTFKCSKSFWKSPTQRDWINISKSRASKTVTAAAATVAAEITLLTFLQLCKEEVLVRKSLTPYCYFL